MLKKTKKQKKENGSIKSDFVYNMAYQIIMTLSPLVLTPKLSRAFGVEYQGIKSYTFSIVYYFAIFGVLGLDMYGQRKIAIERDNLKERNETFWAVSIAKIFLSSFSLILYLIIIQFGFVSRTEFERKVFYCWSFYLVREMINPAFFLQGMGQYKNLSIFGIISQLAYVISAFTFINAQKDLPLYVLFYTLIPLVISVCYYKDVLNCIDKPKIVLKTILESTQKSLVYFIPTVAAAVYSMLDKTMLGFFDSSKMSTGLYEASEKLVKVALAVSTASFTIIRTRMTYLHSNADKELWRKSEHNFVSYTMLLCWPILFGIVGVAEDFVPVFFGTGFEDVVLLSYIFVAVIPCLTISGLLQAIYIIPYGLQKDMDIYYGAIVTINIIMNCLLIPRYGTIGAIIASITAELILAVILLIKARKSIDEKYILSCSIRYLGAAIIMLVAIRFMSAILRCNAIFKIITEFLVALLSYLCMCIIFRDTFVLSQINSIRKRLMNYIHT